MSYLEIKNVNKVYPNGVQAVFNFNLTVEKGEFVVFVGPSGCGKSTMLRMIAGLEEITDGDIILDDKVLNNESPGDRDIAMVFQNYALYSHMTSYQNVGIGLKVRHEPSDLIHQKVMHASDILQLDEYLNRTPKRMSGGQQQRVALGRTIVRDPKLFLMDEPLSNLDALLRDSTRRELVKLYQELNGTTIYVTHDQIEAMTMASKLVVMKDGYVQQIGTPYDVYHTPANVFVGSFIGIPPMNFIKGKFDGKYFHFEGQKIIVSKNHLPSLKKYENKEVIIGIRPEYIQSVRAFGNYNQEEVVKLDVHYSELLGPKYNVKYKVNDDTFIISQIDVRAYDPSRTTDEVVFDVSHAHFFDAKTELRISEE